MKKFDEIDIQRKAEWLVNRVILMNATPLITMMQKDSLENKDDPIMQYDDWFVVPEQCPYCGSSDIEYDSEYKCNKCGETFDEPRTPEVYEYYFIDERWAKDFEKYGETVVYPYYTEPIWYRTSFGQMCCMDGIFRQLAVNLLEEEEKWKAEEK